MPRYNVAITEIVEYLVPVTAENEEAAEEAAEQAFLDGESTQFFVAVRLREVEGVNAVAPEQPQQHTRLAVLASPPDSATFEAHGSWGTLVCDVADGRVVRYDRGGDWEKPGDGYDNIVRLYVDEWRTTYPHGDLKAGHDILDFGSWDTDGHYDGPAEAWRESLWTDRPEIAPEWWRLQQSKKGDQP